MQIIDLSTHYTVAELSTITGIEYTRFYSYQEILKMDKYYLPSGRVGYGLSLKKFEDILEESKSFNFEIPEYDIYKESKRPIVRQFLNSNEVTHFMDLIGDPLSIYSISRRIREDKLPTYAFKRKHLCPIVHLVRRYVIPIDNELNDIIRKVINDNTYQFRL